VHDLDRRIKPFDFHRYRNGLPGNGNGCEVIDVDRIFTGNNATDADNLLPDRRSYLSAADQNEVIGAATVVAIKRHEARFTPAIENHIPQRILYEEIDVVRMIVGPCHRDEELGLAVDFAALRFGCYHEKSDEEQEGHDLKRLEQQQGERVERLISLDEVKIVDHPRTLACRSSAETT
jgi:hypothetical protein